MYTITVTINDGHGGTDVETTTAVVQADAETDGEAKSIALLAILQLLEEGTLLDF